MNLKLTRRQFGQLIIAGTTLAGLGYLTKKTLAQTSNSVVYGIRVKPITSPDDTGSIGEDLPEIDSNTQSTTASTTTSICTGLLVQSLDLGSGTIQTLDVPAVLADGSTPTLSCHEELSDLAILADGTLVVAVTPVSGGKKEANSTHLLVLSPSPTTVAISGLKKQEKLGSVVSTNEGRLLGLVLRKNGRPPVKLVDIDPQTGEITDSIKVKLPKDKRFITLTQCPDGTLYTIAVANDGTSELVQIDYEQNKTSIVSQLSLKNGVLNNGLQSLICSPTGQLLAFGAPRYQTPNNLYTLDAGTGSLTLLQPFDVVKVAIGHS